MSNIDNILRGTFSIVTIIFAFLVVVSSVAAITFSATTEAVEHSPHMIDEDINHDDMLAGSNDISIVDLIGDDAELVQFIEFEPMHINAEPMLNN